MNVGHVVREAATANGDVAAVVPDNGDIMEIKESKNDSFNAVGCILSEKNDFLYLTRFTVRNRHLFERSVNRLSETILSSGLYLTPPL